MIRTVRPVIRNERDDRKDQQGSEAAQPHVHGYDEAGNPVRSEAGDPHFPLEAESIGSIAVDVLSRMSIGVGLMLYSQNAY